MAYRCIIFDFDGTLADTEELVFDIYNAMAKKYKYTPIEKQQLHHLKEMPLHEIMKLIDIPFYKVPFVLKEGRLRLHAKLDAIQAFTPEIGVILNTLCSRMDYIGIVTSNVEPTVRCFLKRYGLERSIDFILCSSLLSKQRQIRKVLKQYNLKKEEVLYVGDESRDIIACHRAGVDIAAVSWGYNTAAALVRCHPTYLIDSLDDLLTILEYQQHE